MEGKFSRLSTFSNDLRPILLNYFTMKTKQKRIVILGAIVIIGSVGFLGVTIRPTSCQPVLSISRSNELIDALDQNSYKFASSSETVLGGSAEGGEQTNFVDNGRRQIVEQRFYGESGKSYERFYYFAGQIFAITKLNIFYKVPIYIDSSAAVKYSEKKDFYLSNNGVVCKWFLNDVEQSVDKDTIDMIHQYISGIITNR